MGTVERTVYVSTVAVTVAAFPCPTTTTTITTSSTQLKRRAKVSVCVCVLPVDGGRWSGKLRLKVRACVSLCLCSTVSLSVCAGIPIDGRRLRRLRPTNRYLQIGEVCVCACRLKCLSVFLAARAQLVFYCTLAELLLCSKDELWIEKFSLSCS